MTSLTEQLAWDTSFFGISIGRVLPEATDLVAAAGEADASGYACTYLLAEAADSSRLIAAQRAGFEVVGMRVELATDQLGIVASCTSSVRAAEPALDEGWLAEIAGRRFTASRFYADSRFDPAQAGRMFEVWVGAALADPARRVVVLEDLTGFVVCAIDSDRQEGVVELIATSLEGRGAGSALIAGAHQWFGERGLHRAAVVTQASNIQALRLYERCGYRTRACSVWLHRWRSCAGQLAEPAPLLSA